MRCSKLPRLRPFSCPAQARRGHNSHSGSATALIGRAQSCLSPVSVSVSLRPLTTIINQGRAYVPAHSTPTCALFTRHLRHASSQSSRAALPQLPPAPPYPCPFLTDAEIQTYLLPLYGREWTVQPSRTAKKPAPELVKRFEFTDDGSSMKAFLEDLKEVTDSENHHAVQDVASSPPSVTIRVHTHSGLRPASIPDEPRKGRVQPGITLRDIRFAYLIEDRFAKYAVADGQSERSRVSSGALEEEQPNSAEALERRRHA